MPSSNGYMVFSALCQWVKNSPVEESFHRLDTPPPFALSPMLPGTGDSLVSDWDQAHLTLPAGTPLFFRLSLLPEFMCRWFPSTVVPKDMRIGNQEPLRFSHVLKPGQSPLAAEIEPTRLAADKPAFRHLALRFFSPTGFNSQGRQMSFPLPELVFTSLLNRWRYWINAQAWPGLEQVLPRINISRYDLKSAVVSGKNKSLRKGCVGFCRYDLTPLRVKERQACHTLAAFARYAGIGYKTGQGLGQAAIV